ncbi:MAG TPA: hypothetical protein VGN97_02210, partial [Mesorhizobium sp.]|nr:hypothetical protein [Mesorhizobium sp.]
LDDLFRRGLLRPGFLSHLRSLISYDEPEILPSSTSPICPISADGGQAILDGRQAPAMQRQTLLRGRGGGTAGDAPYGVMRVATPACWLGEGLAC